MCNVNLFQYSNLFYFLLLFAFSCSSANKKLNKDITLRADPVEQQMIKDVLMTQQIAWNNGDIEAFMDGYWKDENLSFVGKSGVTKSWTQTLINYKKGYPDKATMGKLSFDVIELKQLGFQNYYMIGKYTLKRKEDEPSGYFTLIWEKIDGQWKIISDHTSG